MASSETTPLLPKKESAVEVKPPKPATYPATLEMSIWIPPILFFTISGALSGLLMLPMIPLPGMSSPLVTGKIWAGAWGLIFGLGCGMEALAYAWWLLMKLLTRDDQKFKFPVLILYMFMLCAYIQHISTVFGIDAHGDPIEEKRESTTTSEARRLHT
ncbi:hypothetical protein F5Y00DRAFT_257784 [Daldinia vernicosa]|uniref:uncharacterized protein n=1 Tax=Daldinia vernicosa TaxID=114800 RepID=UPI002008E759|nr:uncharacterized protein F5Y00DRAFT_257784 [Daldinia vernicosa]KAI0853131.1 hypothetical protein F5Y00DRAFT_257784 [Daldinia vernicosa]